MAALARPPAAGSGDAEPAPSTPAAFLRWLHGDLRHRTCVVSRLPVSEDREHEVYRDHTLRHDTIGLQLQCPDVWLEAPDTYVMLHETRRQRLASDVVALKAFVVDLDCHHAADPDPGVVLRQALERLDGSGLPRPHLCVRTGRGVQLLWRIRRVGLKKARRNAQVRWAKTQMALARICGPQADLSLVDLPRIIRLPGTINTRAPAERQRTGTDWVTGASREDYGFDDLCDVALGVARRAFVAKYRQLPAVNEASAGEEVGTRRRLSAAGSPGAAGCGPARATRGYENLARIARARLRDLERIAERFFLVGIPEGYRDTFAMAVATDLSWVTPLHQADHFADQAIHKLRLMGLVVDERTRGACRGRVNPPLSIGEARRNLASVVQRFRDAAAGAKVEFAGELRDPRYWYGTDKRWAALAPLIGSDDGLLATLEEILPRHRRSRRSVTGKRETADGSAAANAAPARALRPRNRVAEGRYKRARPDDVTRSQAVQAVAAGLSVAAAAATAQVTERTVRYWLARNRSAAAPAQTSAAAATPITQASPMHDPGCASDLAGLPERKKRPSPYMAMPGVLRAPSLVGQPECGQPIGLSITEGVSVGGGQAPDRLAGRPQPCAVDGELVQAREHRDASSAAGGGAGEGPAAAPSTVRSPAAAAGQRPNSPLPSYLPRTDVQPVRGGHLCELVTRLVGSGALARPVVPGRHGPVGPRDQQTPVGVGSLSAPAADASQGPGICDGHEAS